MECSLYYGVRSTQPTHSMRSLGQASISLFLGHLLIDVPQDFLMDWSIFRPHAPYKFLRVDLIYTNHITVRASSGHV